MAKDFGKLNNKKFETVAKKSNESANVITVKMIGNDDLIDYPLNNEDISMTDDLELSMKENGFTDPLEVTTYGCEEGKFIIVSGHRRRKAGNNIGISTFPCIVKTFKNDNDVRNYVLLANSQRDSSKDPLLYCKRYKMHEEYLKSTGFKGKVREEIAKRLGLSVQQADRYNQMNKVILTVWDMVKAEKVGISSVLPMSSFSEKEQEEIAEILNATYESGTRLSREVCKKLIDNYRTGNNEAHDSGNPKIIDKQEQVNTNTETIKPNKAYEQENNRNDEVNYDFSHREGLDESKEKTYEDERLNKNDYEVIEKVSENEKKKKLTDEEKRINQGHKLKDLLNKLEEVLNDHYSFDNEDEAMITMYTLTSVTKSIYDGLQYIAEQYDKTDEVLDKQYNILLKDLKGYMKN